jgi:hypothetical protein
LGGTTSNTDLRRRINRRYTLFAWWLHLIVALPLLLHIFPLAMHLVVSVPFMLHTAWIAWLCRPRGIGALRRDVACGISDIFRFAGRLLTWITTSLWGLAWGSIRLGWRLIVRLVTGSEHMLDGLTGWLRRGAVDAAGGAWYFISHSIPALTIMALLTGLVALTFGPLYYNAPGGYALLLIIPLVIAGLMLESLRRREIARALDEAPAQKAKPAAKSKRAPVPAYAIDHDGELLDLTEDELVLIEAHRAGRYGEAE